MGLLDKFLDAMRLNDDYDDDDYEFSNDDYNDESYDEPKRKSSHKASKEKEVKEEPKKNVSKITPINKNTKKQGATATNMEVCVIKPKAIEEEVEIAETLLGGRTVLINMEGLNIEIAQRIIDFTSGATYAMNGNLQKVSNYIFLATPYGVDISGDIQNLMDAFNSENSTLKF